MIVEYSYGSFPGVTGSKESPYQRKRCKRHGFDPWVRKSPGVGSGTRSSILA